MEKIPYHEGSDIPHEVIGPITQENLYLILPFKTSQLSMMMAKKLGLPILDAIRAVYRSNTYRDLANEETSTMIFSISILADFKKNIYLCEKYEKPWLNT